MTGLPSKEQDKSRPINDSLDSLLSHLHDIKATCDSDLPTSRLLHLSKLVDSTKKDVVSRQKDIYSSIARLGKNIDKVTSHIVPWSLVC